MATAQVAYENGTKETLEKRSAAITMLYFSQCLEQWNYKVLADRSKDKKELEVLVGGPVELKLVEEVAELLQKLTETFPDAGVENMTQQCERLDVHHANARRKYDLTVKHLFNDGITWGRVTLFYAFSTGFALHVVDRQMDELVDSVATWSVQQMKSKVNQWIHENGGWVSATLYFVAQGSII